MPKILILKRFTVNLIHFVEGLKVQEYLSNLEKTVGYSLNPKKVN